MGILSNVQARSRLWDDLRTTAPGSATAGARVKAPETNGNAPDLRALLQGGVQADTGMAREALLPGDSAVPLFNRNNRVIDVEVTSDGTAAYQTLRTLNFTSIDTATGAIDPLGTRWTADVLPLGPSRQGPELIETADGVKAIGTTRDGLVVFDADSFALIPGTEGYKMGFAPKEVPCDTLRFTAVALDGSNSILYNGGTITELPFNMEQRFPVPWLSATELIVQLPDGYFIYDIGTQEYETVSTRAYVPETSSLSNGRVTEDGERVLFLCDDVMSDIYIDGGSGWELARQLVSPFGEFYRFWSVEIVEWQDGLWFVGMMLNESKDASVLAMYDFDNDAWLQLTGAPGRQMDPEPLVLDNGDLAIYFFEDFRSYYLTVDADSVATIPNLVTAAAAARSAPDGVPGGPPDGVPGGPPDGIPGGPPDGVPGGPPADLPLAAYPEPELSLIDEFDLG